MSGVHAGVGSREVILDFRMSSNSLKGKELIAETLETNIGVYTLVCQYEYDGRIASRSLSCEYRIAYGGGRRSDA